MFAIDSRRKAILCARACLDKKAENVLMLDMRRISNITDFFVICDGASARQVRAIADSVLETSKAHKQRPWHVEGYDQEGWILLDYSDVVVHIFYKDMREFYKLERLWADAPREVVVALREKGSYDRR